MQVILSDKDLLEAFNQLRVKGYNWARFTITADEDCVSSFSSTVQPSNKSVDQYVTLEDQFPVHLNEDIEFNWIVGRPIDTLSIDDKNPSEAAIKVLSKGDNDENSEVATKVLPNE
ncbi:hypothetical protein WN944_018890 [Citrus x changshan-huyou]|uniref:Uncharacterized protein n=1 Tax=Citrus x changshan-huyou TaxID=2935761 RepID=A0AAP0LYW8_9ROSI